MRMAVSHKYKELGEILLKVRMRYTLDSFFCFYSRRVYVYTTDLEGWVYVYTQQ